MTWRVHLKDFIYPLGLTHLYEFGVYSGESMIDIQNLYNDKGINIEAFYGFDSFEGMPEETAEPLAQEGWAKGKFNACERFKAESPLDCSNKVIDHILKECKFQCAQTIRMIPGFFEDTLVDDLVQRCKMKPAAFVDLDADIYSSTLTALDFMCRNKLIVPGTLLAYDDWGGTPGWETMADGESRAHKEITEKYKMTTTHLVQFGNTFPHVQKLFIVESING